MKLHLSILTGVASVAAIMSNVFADTAVTDPVGYISHTIAGNVAAGPSGADTMIAPTLDNKIEFAGTSTADPSSTNTIDFLSGVPAGLDSTYLVEIKSATREGWWSTIVSSTGTQIVTTDALPAGLGGVISVNVRKVKTLMDFLGANAAGFSAVDGVNPDPPDEVQILDPITQSTVSAVWVTGVAPDGWYDSVTQLDISNTPLYPGTALKVRRYGATGVNFTTVGHVKLTKTEVDIFPADNWLAPTKSVGDVMGNLNLLNTLNQEDFDPMTSPEADILSIIRADQSTDIYASISPLIIPPDGQLANLVTQADATTELIKEGTGVIINRPSLTAGIWVVPAQVVAP